MRFMGPLVLGLTVALTAPPALAQKAEADAAFRRGKALMAKGKTAEACAEFETSMRLEPLSGTLYNLALCHEALGKIASAWSELEELAANDKNAARAKDAAKRAAALRKQLTRMRIVVAAPVDGLVIKRDSVDVTALVGKDVPVDPARYAFIASAPGHADATVDVDLSMPGKTIDVTIPALVPSSIGGGDGGVGPAPMTALTTDPYADRLTLRPLVVPNRVLEADAHVAWTSSPRFDGAGRSEPIETVIGARRGFGPLQAHANISIHTRYATEDYRPRIIEYVTAGADYVITPLFTAGATYRKYHPFGGDLAQGSDFRADIGRKKIISRTVALVGYAGLGFQSRHTRGQSGTPNAFQLIGDGAVQLSPRGRLTFEALAALRFNMTGDLYGDSTFLLDVGARATAYLTRQLDAYISTVLVVLPQANEDRVFTFGLKYRHP